MSPSSMFEVPDQNFFSALCRGLINLPVSFSHLCLATGDTQEELAPC